ncbi:MAG: hemerythrin family protein [Gammaproteobacteria bacterium]|nr:hemerythrin family protein [Gammaproteobacteria bacterium]MCB1924470.1 hemerythrin family protein [Gammaproteobacteria bacterium]
MADVLQDYRYLAEDQRLGVASMDDTHEEFLSLYEHLRQADNAAFPQLFRLMCEHTRAHFAAEEALMKATDFPALAEHTADHMRVLGELDRFLSRAQGGRQQLARAWINEQLPEWFRAHLLNMDSALAAHIVGREKPRHVHLRLLRD